jgi:hypothetical protein
MRDKTKERQKKKKIKAKVGDLKPVKDARRV